MEFQLGLSLSTHKPSVLDDDDDDDDSCLLHINNIKKKRNFEDAFGNKFKEQSKTTLPLLLWSGLPNDDDDDDDKDHTNRLSCCLINNNGEVVEEDDFDDGHVVGWPPIKSWRKKVLHHQQGGRILKKRVAAAVDHGGSKNMYVKVKMEGVAIARKIDLGLFHSYQTLTNSLISMFAKCQQIEKDSANYRLTYLDKDGDWLLAGDVPWQTFIESVQRLELLKKWKLKN